MFAFGFAKLGEATAAKELTTAARAALDDPRAADDRRAVAGFLFKAFEYRIGQALAGKPLAGLFDAGLLADLAALAKKRDDFDADKKKSGSGNQTNPFGLAYYTIGRMREQSQILEPQEAQNPYAEQMKYGNEIQREAADLPKEMDPGRLAKRIRDLYRGTAQVKATAETRFQVLHAALPLAARVGEAFTGELLGLVPEAMKAYTGSTPPPPADLPKLQGELFERALFLAAHFDRTELVKTLLDQLVGHIRAKPDEQRYELVNVVAGQCLRSLRKLGLRDEIDKLLGRLQDEVLRGKPLPQLRQQYAAKPDVWADVLRTTLNLAAGWLTFGLVDQAAPVLEAARQEILSGASKVPVLKFTKLAETYVAALGQGPAEYGLQRIVELFEKLDPARVTNTFTTSQFYSRLHLNLVEEVVLAVVSDDFILGQAGRRWLDEDEYLVRRRIHADMRRHLEAGGL
jgi:hypothetical protein